MPLDIDLEDKLIYGLTPTRFGYLAMAVLAAMVVWAGGRPPLVPRLAAAVILLLSGAALGWATFRGRHLDNWAFDAGRYLVANHRIRVERSTAKTSDS